MHKEDAQVTLTVFGKVMGAEEPTLTDTWDDASVPRYDQKLQAEFNIAGFDVTATMHRSFNPTKLSVMVHDVRHLDKEYTSDWLVVSVKGEPGLVLSTVRMALGEYIGELAANEVSNDDH